MNNAIGNNIYGPGHYQIIKLSEGRQEKTTIIRYHLYEESKKKIIIQMHLFA